MTEKYNFNVDENGEDALLYFLKHGMKKEFDEALAAGHDPFVPSPYGQCCAGLAGGTGFLEFERFESLDWAFDETGTIKTAVYPTPQFLRHASESRLAYTLPYLSGVHRAAAMGNCDEIERLKDHVNERDAFGYLPLIYAVGCCKREAAALLGKIGGHQDARQGSLLLKPYDVVSGGRYSLPISLQYLWPSLKTVRPEDSPARNAVTIHQAAAKGDVELVRTLLDLGVPVDIRSYNGSTPLLCAVKYGRDEACRILTEAGADLDAVNYLGESPRSLVDRFRRERASVPIFQVQHSLSTRFRLLNEIGLIFLEYALQLLPDSGEDSSPEASESKSATPAPAIPATVQKGGASSEEHYRDEKAVALKGVESSDEGRTTVVELTDAVQNDEPTSPGQSAEESQPADSGSSVLVDQIVSLVVEGAAIGNLQQVIHAYYLLSEEDRSRIPKHLAEEALSLSTLREMLRTGAWLYLKVGLPVARIDNWVAENSPLNPEKIISEGDPILILAWIKEHGISGDNGVMFDLACQREDAPAVELLLALGTVGICGGLGIIGDQVGQELKRRAESIARRPDLVDDDLLFAVTTGNNEFLIDAFEAGLDLGAKTKHGLDLHEVAKSFDLPELASMLVMLESGANSDDVRDAFIREQSFGYVEGSCHDWLKVSSVATGGSESAEISDEEYVEDEETNFIPLGAGNGDDEPDVGSGKQVARSTVSDDEDGANVVAHVSENNGSASTGLLPTIMTDDDDEEEMSDCSIPLGAGSVHGSHADASQRQAVDPAPDTGSLCGLFLPSASDGDDELPAVVPVRSTGRAEVAEGTSEAAVDGRDMLDRILVAPMRPRVEKEVCDALASVFAPPFIVDVFLKAQSCRDDDELRALVNGDDVTLELFWAMKLYAEAKAATLAARN